MVTEAHCNFSWILPEAATRWMLYDIKPDRRKSPRRMKRFRYSTIVNNIIDYLCSMEVLLTRQEVEMTSD
jgi:hypothetical protein